MDSSSDSATWWTAESEGLCGPFRREEIFAAIRVGRITDRTLVREGAAGEWVPAVDAFPKAFPSGPPAPVIEPVSEPEGSPPAGLGSAVPFLGAGWRGMGAYIGGTWKAVFTSHSIVAFKHSITKPSAAVHDNSEFPWAFSRVLLLGIAAFWAVVLVTALTGSLVLLPVAVFLGAATLPIVVVVFFYEANIAHNVSLLRLFWLAGVGGVGATAADRVLVSTLLMNWEVGRFLDPLLEISILLVFVVLLTKNLSREWATTGLVAGAAVGAGYVIVDRFWLWLGWGNEFASFEGSVGLILRYAWTLAGTATVWVAIATAGLWIAYGSAERRGLMVLLKPAFLIPFVAVFLLSVFFRLAMEVGIFDYFAAAVLWLLLIAGAFLLALTYVVASRNEPPARHRAGDSSMTN